MSMNLYLEFYDSKDRCVNRIDLIQTSTNTTLKILGYHSSMCADNPLHFKVVFDRYLAWVKKLFDPSILETERNKIQEAIDEYGDDYIPKWCIR